MQNRIILNRCVPGNPIGFEVSQGRLRRPCGQQKPDSGHPESGRVGNLKRFSERLFRNTKFMQLIDALGDSDGISHTEFLTQISAMNLNGAFGNL